MPPDTVLEDTPKIRRDWGVTYRIPDADLGKVQDACLQVKEILESSGLGAQTMRDNIELVLAEVLTNIVEHGYCLDRGAIVINAAKSGNCVDFVIADHGAQMPGLALPVGQLPNISRPIEDLPEGGFGWLLIHALTKDLSYSRSRQKNELRFSFDL